MLLVLPPYLSRNPPSHGSATGMRLYGLEKHTHQTKWTQRWSGKAKDKLHVEEKKDYISEAEEINDKKLNKSGNSLRLI